MTAKEFKQKVTTSINMEQEEKDTLEQIGWREHKSQTEMIRRAIQDFIKAHASGNNTFKLDNWNENPDFRAVPTILSRQETWYEYLKECTPQERMEIQKKAVSIKNQCIALK